MTTKFQFRRGTAAAWTSANPTLAAGEPGFETDTGKVKIGDGTTAWNSLAYLAGTAAGVDSIAKNGSTGLTGDVTLSEGTNVTLTQSGNDIAIAASGGGGGIGASELIYRYTVTGSDKASIDTGVDTADAGSNDWTNGDLLEVFFVGRTDEAATGSQVDVILNNDTGSNYRRQYLEGNDTTVAAATGATSNGFPLALPGTSYAANYPGMLHLEFPNYAGTTFYKVCFIHRGVNDSTAALNDHFFYTATYLSTSALSRLKIVPDTAGKKFKVGTQLLIYKRLAS